MIIFVKKCLKGIQITYSPCNASKIMTTFKKLAQKKKTCIAKKNVAKNITFGLKTSSIHFINWNSF